ncbi:hypothetical protein SAMN05421664_2016 [Chryseobacterium soldanellicola]|uniref:Uncharacterized protein n=1 Tax=Chryseobacterium soldanellicola TaxID=311333 RepID=A0A1H1CLQ4_9FLAO|nr:hypothetical protein [Chryseobacterium soldanellicola]SDQ64988.1 hypothetical protein SAMN05421664_2016 [Chryseobacterium soldanellicola]
MKAYIKGILPIILLGGMITSNAQAVGTPYIPMIDIPFSFLYGGNGADSPRTHALSLAADGGYFGVGDSTSSVNGDVTGTNGGNRDNWVTKWDTTGKIVWQRLVGGNGIELGTAITATSDGGCIVVSRSGSNNIPGTTFHGGTDLLAAKLDASGNIQWQRLVGGSGNDEPSKVAIGTDGGYIIAGVSYSVDGDLTGIPKYTGGTFGTDAWLVKLNADGTINWQKRYGGTDEDSFGNVIATNDGGYLLTGTTSSGAVGDFTGLPVFAGPNPFVMKTDALGNRTWIKRFGVSAAANPFTYDVRQITGGGYIFAIRTGDSNTGSLSGIVGFGGNDIWIMKLDAAGNLVTQKLFGGTGSDIPTSINETHDGGYMVSGGSASSNTGTLTGIVSHGGNDSWVFKLDASLNVTQQKLYGGNGNEGSTGAYLLPLTNESSYLLLSDSGSSSNGDVTDVNHAPGTADYWLLKLLPSGEITWVPDVGQR